MRRNRGPVDGGRGDPLRIRELIQRGVEFSRSKRSDAEGGYDLGKEEGTLVAGYFMLQI